MYYTYIYIYTYLSLSIYIYIHICLPSSPRCPRAWSRRPDSDLPQREAQSTSLNKIRAARAITTTTTISTTSTTTTTTTILLLLLLLLLLLILVSPSCGVPSCETVK